MKIRQLLNELKKYHVLSIILISLMVFLTIFLMFKNEYFYYVTEYIEKYINYYKDKYLNGDPSGLIVYNYIGEIDIPKYINIFIENDVTGIYSRYFLYVASFGHTLFSFYTFIIPFIIFLYIIKNNYDEIYNKASIVFISRIGLKKYINNKLFTNIVTCSLIIFIPRLLYFILLSIFFPASVSDVHFIEELSFLSQSFLYAKYSYYPLVIIFVDFLISVIYGAVLACLSMIVVLTIKNKSLSYIIYAFILFAISIFAILIKVPYIFSYISLFTYNNALKTGPINTLFEPVMFILVFFIMLFIVVKLLYKRQVINNI